jgi:ABC-type histidine transport system ATPase subunit
MAIIEIEDVRKRYGDTEALRGVSLAVEEGEIFGILGRRRPSRRPRRPEWAVRRRGGD